MWTMNHNIKKVLQEQITYWIDTAAGQSGSSVWHQEDDDYHIVGIHTLGWIGRISDPERENYGVRISRDKYYQICKWVEEYLYKDPLPILPSSSTTSLYASSSLLTLPFSLPAIPLIAQGHEKAYERFLKGVLVYRPTPHSDAGQVNLQISALANPLDGTFDLSQCGDANKYLSISTGYRKRKKSENANKVEIWLMPRFLIERELNTTAWHFRAIFPKKWPTTSPVGICWSWGSWDNMGWYDYLTNQSMGELSSSNLYQKWYALPYRCPINRSYPTQGAIYQKFYIYFAN